MSEQEERFAAHARTIAYAAEKHISYAEAGERMSAEQQLKSAATMAPHFVALAVIRVEGITQRSPDFAERYQYALGKIRREREQAATAKPVAIAPPATTKHVTAAPAGKATIAATAPQSAAPNETQILDAAVVLLKNHAFARDGQSVAFLRSHVARTVTNGAQRLNAALSASRPQSSRAEFVNAADVLTRSVKARMAAAA